MIRAKESIDMTLTRTVFVLLILCAASAAAAVPDAPRAFQGAYWYVFDNVTRAAPDAEIELVVAVPKDRAHQEIKVGAIDPLPARVVEDPVQGNTLVVWKVRPDGASGQLYFHIAVTGEARPIRTNVNPVLVGAPDRESELYTTWTRAETWLPTDGEVAATARRIVGAETNPYLQARALFDWIVETLTFVPGGTPKRSAAATLKGLRGDCGQYSQLFTAMCRSLGIPARTVTNVWLDGGGRHRYAEFHIEPYGWIPADPASAQALTEGHTIFDETDRKAFALLRGIPDGDPDWLFGNLYRNHMAVTVGNDIVLPGADGAPDRVFQALEPGGRDAWPAAVTIRGLNPDVVHGGFWVFDRDLSLEEVHQTAHERLADQFFDVGLVAPVEEGCLMSSDRNTDGADTWVSLGRVALHKKEYARAEACFRRAIKAPSGRRGEKLRTLVWAHLYLGNTYDLMGRRDLAEKEYRRALELGVDVQGSTDYARKYLASPFLGRDVIQRY